MPYRSPKSRTGSPWGLQPETAPPPRLGLPTPFGDSQIGTTNQRQKGRSMPEPPGLAPISQIPPRRRSRSPSVPGRGHPCPICHEIFNTVRGLGVHHAAKHRAQRDQQITQERQNITKARWDPEERHLLAEKEAELTRKGVKLLNRELREAFPHRSLEAIKGQRRTPAHKTDFNTTSTISTSNYELCRACGGACNPSDWETPIAELGVGGSPPCLSSNPIHIRDIPSNKLANPKCGNSQVTT